MSRHGVGDLGSRYVYGLALAAVLLFASAAQGMYDPHHGRWFQRDPLGVRPDAPRGEVDMPEKSEIAQEDGQDEFVSRMVVSTFLLGLVAHEDLAQAEAFINRYEHDGDHSELAIGRSGWPPHWEQYSDGGSPYEYVRSKPNTWYDPYGKSGCRCKWDGTISGHFVGTFIGGWMKVSVSATGTDGVCNYAVSGAGKAWFHGAMLGIGWLSVSATIEGHEAACMWPLANGDFGSFGCVGMGANVGVGLNASWVYGRAGDLEGTAWFNAGGINAFAGGGGFQAPLWDVRRVGPSPVGK